MRIATFNLENLDLPPRADLPIAARAEVLRPLLDRCDADILCLQEVNGQHVAGRPGRTLEALRELLDGTRYEGFQMAATRANDGVGARDVHNLVTLSRWRIDGSRDIRHQHSQPLEWRSATTDPSEPEPRPILLDRPFLVTDIERPDATRLSILNVHFRAPRASAIAGGKDADGIWRSTSAWAEGYFVSTVKRAQQALEVRLEVDRILAADRTRRVAVVGDFNAEDHDSAIRIVMAAEDDTGNGALAARSLIMADRSLPEDRRWSTIHAGRRQMLDHILINRSFYARLRQVEVYNEALGDETGSEGSPSPGSNHAPVVAVFQD